ncbi:MAG: PaaI family thioesterase [Planctomycetota bacterium]
MTIEAAHKTVADIRNLVHPKCVVCSFGNGNGLHLEFDVADDGSVTATFQCDEAFEGYPGILHGGVIASILDGAMGNCMFARSLATVTVEMTTRFRHPIITGREAMVSARITRSSHPLYLLEADIRQNGKVKATAKGKYYNQPKLIME